MPVNGKKVAQCARTLDPKLVAKDICWDAVFHCLYLAKQITEADYNHLKHAFDNDRWRRSWSNRLLKDTTSRVSDNGALMKVESGCFLAFINDTSSRGLPPLAHAMLALEKGTGQAAGNNNACIGKSPAWSIVDLTEVWRWDTPGKFKKTSNGTETVELHSVSIDSLLDQVKQLKVEEVKGRANPLDFANKPATKCAIL